MELLLRGNGILGTHDFDYYDVVALNYISCVIGCSTSNAMWKIKDVRDQLSVVGIEIPDDDTVILVLKGLPYEYNTVKAVIRGRDHGISLKDLRSQLKAEEATIEESTHNVPITSAMAAATQNSSSGSGMNSVPYSPMPYGSRNSSSGFQDKGKGKMFYT
ncbi:unnamed protein product [Prunus armeniaca]